MCQGNGRLSKILGRLVVACEKALKKTININNNTENIKYRNPGGINYF